MYSKIVLLRVTTKTDTSCGKNSFASSVLVTSTENRVVSSQKLQGYLNDKERKTSEKKGTYR